MLFKPKKPLKYPDKKLWAYTFVFGVINLAIALLLGFLWVWGIWDPETFKLDGIITFHGVVGFIGTLGGGLGYYVEW